MKTKLFFAIILVLTFVGLIGVQLALACYGPHINAEVSQTQVNLGETIVVSGQICSNLTGTNVTVAVTFIRPDFSWMEYTILTDEVTGEFQVSQEMDMPGYWNIIPKLEHMSDRLGVTVVVPEGVDVSPVESSVQPFQFSIPLLMAAIFAVGVGGVVAVTGLRKKTRSISSWRFLVQIIFVLLIFFGMLVDHQFVPSPVRQLMVHEYLESPEILDVTLPDGLPIPVFGCYYPCGRTATCALWEIQAYIYPMWDTGDGWGVEYNSPGIVRLAIVIGLVMLMSVVLGRFFCGWICPFGLYMDLLTHLRKFFKIKHKDFSESFNQKIHQLGYVIFALIIVVCVILGSEAIFGSQLVPGTEDGGFVYQYFSAPFCQVCPMKPFCVLLQGSVGIIKPEWIAEVTTGNFWELGYYITSINVPIFAAVTVVSFYYRRAWCRICPLGALIALFSRVPPFKWISVLRLDKTEEKCSKCGICKRVCPTQVTEVYEKTGGDVTNSQCIMCMRCIEMCPNKDALKLRIAGKPTLKSRNWLK